MHWIVLSWLFFGLVHSLMATDRVKTTVREYHGLTGKRYRQLYNVIAILSLAAALLVTTNYSGTSIIRWSGGWLFFPVLAWIIAIVFFVIPALAYDMGQFAGTHPEFCDDSLTSPSPSPSTSTSASVSTSTGLALSWCHRYVRHPWYFAILLIIWFRNLNDGWLVANICLTIYVIVGIVCEETRLVSRFGSAWLDYRKQVAALIPLPGRSLTAAQLRQIQQSSVAHDRT